MCKNTKSQTKKKRTQTKQMTTLRLAREKRNQLPFQIFDPSSLLEINSQACNAALEVFFVPVSLLSDDRLKQLFVNLSSIQRFDRLLYEDLLQVSKNSTGINRYCVLIIILLVCDEMVRYHAKSLYIFCSLVIQLLGPLGNSRLPNPRSEKELVEFCIDCVETSRMVVEHGSLRFLLMGHWRTRFVAELDEHFQGHLGTVKARKTPDIELLTFALIFTLRLLDSNAWELNQGLIRSFVGSYFIMIC